MRFIDQLKAEVKIHGDMETDFRSRRYHHKIINLHLNI